MSSKIPKWIILCQSQTLKENVASRGGVSKEAQVWIMERGKKGSRKRMCELADQVDKKKCYQGRFVRWHAHWHKRGDAAAKAKRVTTIIGGASKKKCKIWVDSKVGESDEGIQIDEPQQHRTGVKIVAAASKTKYELPNNTKAPDAEKVIEIDGPELRTRIVVGTCKAKSELPNDSKVSEPEKTTEMDEPELQMWTNTAGATCKTKSELPAQVERVIEVDEPKLQMWIDIVGPTCKTKSELPDDANVSEAEQGMKINETRSGTRSDLSDVTEVCEFDKSVNTDEATSETTSASGGSAEPEKGAKIKLHLEGSPNLRMSPRYVIQKRRGSPRKKVMINLYNLYK